MFTASLHVSLSPLASASSADRPHEPVRTMSWMLHRVDDRLIHGQIVVAWAGRMRPRRIWVAGIAIVGVLTKEV